MPQSITSEQVRGVVANEVGYDPVRVARLDGSVANQNFRVECAEGTQVVLKAGPGDEIAAEAWACGRLLRIGVPVPRVLAFDRNPSRLGSAFLIASFVAGEPTSDADAVRDTGVWFRRVHEERVPGWGRVRVTPGAIAEAEVAVGGYPSWREAVEADLAGLSALVEAEILPPGLADDACRVVGDLEYDGPGVLLHNDLKPAHIFGTSTAGRRRLSAIIDWGDASVGDPAADLARLSMAGPAVTVAFLEGYGAALTDDLADRLARYRVLWNVRALSYEFEAGGDWFDAYRDGIREDIGPLLA